MTISLEGFWRHRQRVLVAVAMRRSGHHAVLNQLCQQFGGVLHLNNCVIRGRPRRLHPKTGRFLLYRDWGVRDTRQQGHIRYRLNARLQPWTSSLLYSLEDPDPLLDYRPFVEKHERFTLLCIARDPFNWLASSLKQGGRMVEDLPRRISLWKRHIRLCLDPGQYTDADFVDINYNRWVAERDYREAVSTRLGLTYSETGREEVREFGLGSSFDGTQLDGKASEMRVLERWRGFEDDERFQRLAQAPEIAELSEAYFGFNPLRAAS